MKGGRVRLETVGLELVVTSGEVGRTHHRGNAFEFTGCRPRATIGVGATVDGGRRVYFVGDDCAGFDDRGPVDGVAS